MIICQISKLCNFLYTCAMLQFCLITNMSHELSFMKYFKSITKAISLFLTELVRVIGLVIDEFESLCEDLSFLHEFQEAVGSNLSYIGLSYAVSYIIGIQNLKEVQIQVHRDRRLDLR